MIKFYCEMTDQERRIQIVTQWMGKTTKGVDTN